MRYHKTDTPAQILAQVERSSHFAAWCLANGWQDATSTGTLMVREGRFGGAEICESFAVAESYLAEIDAQAALVEGVARGMGVEEILALVEVDAGEALDLIRGELLEVA